MSPRKSLNKPQIIGTSLLVGRVIILIVKSKPTDLRQRAMVVASYNAKDFTIFSQNTRIKPSDTI